MLRRILTMSSFHIMILSHYKVTWHPKVTNLQVKLPYYISLFPELDNMACFEFALVGNCVVMLHLSSLCKKLVAKSLFVLLTMICLLTWWHWKCQSLKYLKWPYDDLGLSTDFRVRLRIILDRPNQVLPCRCEYPSSDIFQKTVTSNFYIIIHNMYLSLICSFETTLCSAFLENEKKNMPTSAHKCKSFRLWNSQNQSGGFFFIICLQIITRSFMSVPQTLCPGSLSGVSKWT